MNRKIQPKKWRCPKCGETRVERLAKAVAHPCKQENKNIIAFKEVKEDG